MGTDRWVRLLTDTEDDEEDDVDDQLPECGTYVDLPVLLLGHLPGGPHTCREPHLSDYTCHTSPITHTHLPDHTCQTIPITHLR